MPDLVVSNATPLHAFCVYAESLAAQRRVVVIGDASLGLDALLLGLGARSVHFYDPDPVRAREAAPRAPRGATVRELPAGDFEVRDGAFDLAFVLDLGSIADRPGLLSRLRRLLAPAGAALISTPASPGPGGSGIDYYELYDLVSLQFAAVRMIGQVPFRGVAIAELGDPGAEPTVSVDTQLVTEAPPPSAYLALASQSDVRLDPYAIVQLPFVAAAVPVPSVLPTPGPASRDPQREAERAAAALHAEALQVELDVQRSLAQALAAEVDRAQRAPVGPDPRAYEDEIARAHAEVRRLGGEVERAARRHADVEAELSQARQNPELARVRESFVHLEARALAQAAAFAVQAEENDALRDALVEAQNALVVREQQVARSAGEREALQDALRGSRAELGQASAEAERLRPLSNVVELLQLRAERADVRSASLEAQLQGLADAHTRELDELERLLRQRAQAIAGLEHEMVRREHLVHELVAVMEEARDGAPGADGAREAPELDRRLERVVAVDQEAGAPLAALSHDNAELRTRLDALALEIARREGELHSRGWRIQELEEQLSLREAAAFFATKPAPAAEAPAVEDGAPTPDALEAVAAPLRAELDALRQALLQEHEARRLAEAAPRPSPSEAPPGGDDADALAAARAELSRQATLVEQLSRELERARGAGGAPTEGGPEAAQGSLD